MAHEDGNVKWWDWLFSPPPMATLWLLVSELSPDFIGDQHVRRQVTVCVAYVVCLTMALWGLSWWKRFGWKSRLPGKLMVFWLAAAFVAFLIIFIARLVLSFFQAGTSG